MTQTQPASRRRLRDPRVLAWLRLARVHQQIERAAAEHLRRWNLSVPQFDILAHVGAAAGITQQELAAVRLTTKGNLSQLLDHVETAGLIRRVREGRAKRLYLTERGAQLFAEVVPDHEAVISALLAGLAPADTGRLLSLLRSLDRSLGQEKSACPDQ